MTSGGRFVGSRFFGHLVRKSLTRQQIDTLLNQALSVLLFVTLLPSVGTATTISISTVTQLMSAVNNGVAGDTINVAAGTYALTATLNPKARMTIKGAGITTTILQPASSWNPGIVNPIYDPTITSENKAAYYFNVAGNSSITISDMTMDGKKQLQGAIVGNGSNYLTVYNTYFHDYTFCGLRVHNANNFIIHDCEFIKMANNGMDPEAGAITISYLTNSEFYNNQVYCSTHGVFYGGSSSDGNFFGIKGRQLRHSRIHDNTILIHFSMEFPFEQDQDVEIDHNYLMGWISVPVYAGGVVPPSGVTFHVHHNYLDKGAFMEYPRNGVEIDHNFIENTRNEPGVLLTSANDAYRSGPTKMHDNLVRNLGMAIAELWQYDNFQFYNNWLISTPNAGNTWNGTLWNVCFKFSSQNSTRVFKDNIFDCTAFARSLFWGGMGSGFVVQNNTLTNVTDQANYTNPNTGAVRGPIAPLSFACGAIGKRFCVDQWTITSCNASTHPQNENKNSASAAFMPNAAALSALIRYRLSESSRISISVSDVSGKEVMQVADQMQSAGEHALNINAGRLQDRVYIVRMKVNREQVMQRLIIKVK